jgi:ABC-type polysaccharide/polyol phosphate transport system ATPase subunit
MTTRALATGEIAADGLGRVFEIRLVKNRSLKETILRRSLPPKRRLWALRDVDLHVQPGESFGIVGQNGSGKSTLLKLIAGIFAPSTGTLEVGGRVGSLIELGAGFHPEFTGVENVYLNAAIHGISRSYVDEHLDEIIAFAELEDFADMAVKAYSSGMFTRLGFSVAMHINPDILLLDEVLAVGDEVFQQKCYAKIWDFKRAGGTIVFVSHDAGSVERLCDRAILLRQGRIAHEGSAEDVLRAYHRSLADRASVAAAPGGAAQASASCRVHEVAAVSGDGARRDSLVEGEPFALEIWLYSRTGAQDLDVTIALRETSGQAVGSQTASGVDLRPERLEPLKLHLPEPPLRDGRFFVDVRVATQSGDAELALVERALELSVFSRDPGAAGPIRLGGAWELPAAAADSEPELPTAERA